MNVMLEPHVKTTHRVSIFLAAMFATVHQATKVSTVIKRLTNVIPALVLIMVHVKMKLQIILVIADLGILGEGNTWWLSFNLLSHNPLTRRVCFRPEDIS